MRQYPRELARIPGEGKAAPMRGGKGEHSLAPDAPGLVYRELSNEQAQWLDSVKGQTIKDPPLIGRFGEPKVPLRWPESFVQSSY
jgi:hypothetical protein